uniref:hypothetical protein n=1 Tax=Eubacterium cellulosolvens TaxID=29322 RepID=UPI0004856D9B|nr:hypothetical protein [[Eubacterium] cellulosolvens]
MEKDAEIELECSTTESTEPIDTVEVGGKFEIILDVKKINTSKRIEFSRFEESPNVSMTFW